MAFQRKTGTFSTLETILRLQGLFRHRLQPLRVSLLQASVLLYLDRHPRCTLTEITSALCTSPPSTITTVRFMQKKGWLHKTQVHEKGRIVPQRLTEKGNALVQQIKENIHVTDKLFSLAQSRKAA
ncbi:MAG: MarR family transcriptional regulator [Nitrospira sp.]